MHNSSWPSICISFSFSVAVSTLPALPGNVIALPADVTITACSLKIAKLIAIFAFAYLTCAITELRPQSGFRNKTACAPFEIPESRERDAES